MFHGFVWLVLDPSYTARCWSARLWTPRLKAGHLRGGSTWSTTSTYTLLITVWSGCNSGLGEDRILFVLITSLGSAEDIGDPFPEQSKEVRRRRTTDTDHFATQGNCYFKQVCRGFTIRFLKFLAMRIMVLHINHKSAETTVWKAQQTPAINIK